MFAFLTPYALLLKIGAVIVMVAALVYGGHTYNKYRENIGYQRAVSEYQTKLIEAQNQARKTEETWKQQQEVSNAKATKRQQVLASNLATANLANRGLLDDLANIRSQLPSDTQSAAAQRAITLSNVFGDCSTEVVRLATLGDRWANEAVRCVESWPK